MKKFHRIYSQLQPILLTAGLLLKVFPQDPMNMDQHLRRMKQVTQRYEWLVNNTGTPKECPTEMNSPN